MPGSEPQLIVAGVTDTEPYEPVLDWASGLAAAFGDRLRLVTAFQAPTGHGWTPRLAGYPIQSAERIHTTALALLAECRTEAMARQPGIEPQIAAVEGSPIDVLVDESHRAGLLVLGSQALPAGARWFVGSVGHAVAMRAACPVLLTRAVEYAAAEKIVVGLDLATDTTAVLNFACRLAAPNALPVEAVVCWRPATGQKLARVTGHVGEDLPLITTALNDRLLPWRAQYCQLAIHAVVRTGGPTPELLEQAGANPLVLGRHRRHVVPALGSAHLGALQHAAGAVAVVPG